jgi:hypothetical protein
MSDLNELLEAVTVRMVETVNDLMAESGGEPFGLGDLRPLAADLIDYTLNREFGPEYEISCRHCGAGASERLSICDGVCNDCEERGAPTLPDGSGWCDDPNCRLCRKEAQVMPKLGQCAECPYKLTGVMAQTGCPNCPHRGGDID